MFNLETGVLELIYTFLVGVANPETELEVLKAGLDYDVLCFSISWTLFAFYFIGHALSYVFFAITLNSLYNKKGLSGKWQCFVPVVQFYALCRVIGSDRLWNMKKSTLFIIFISCFAFFTALKVFWEFFYYKDVLKYIFLRKRIYPVNKNTSWLIYLLLESLLISSVVFLYPIISDYFKERSNAYVILTIVSCLSIFVFALLVLIFRNKKPRIPYYAVTYGSGNPHDYNDPYNRGYRGPYYGPRYNENPHAPEEPPVKEPFSEFEEEKKSQPFADFYSQEGWQQKTDYQRDTQEKKEDKQDDKDDLF